MEEKTSTNLSAINDIYATHSGLKSREEDVENPVEEPGTPEEHQGNPDAEAGTRVNRDGLTAAELVEAGEVDGHEGEAHADTYDGPEVHPVTETADPETDGVGEGEGELEGEQEEDES